MIQYSPKIEFQGHLLSVVDSAISIPINMFDKIIDMILMHCLEGNLDLTLHTSTMPRMNCSRG